MAKQADPSVLLAKTLADLEKKLGKGMIHSAADMPAVYHLAFRNPTLNYATEGGAPWNRSISMYGDESCLAGSTLLKYQARTPEGEMRDSKGGTLERLYERFNNVLLRPGKGRYLRRDDSIFYLPSIDVDGKVVQNRVVDVVRTGSKRCVRIKTEKGLAIESTVDHEFMTVDGFRSAGELVVGDAVMVHDSTRYRGSHGGRQRRSETTVKHHGTAPSRLINGYRYHRLRVAQLVIEADMNGLSVDDYRTRLNAGQLGGLVFVDTSVEHVHHRDENAANDAVDNLQLIDPSSHGRLHATRRLRELSFIAIEHEIVSIEEVGERDTFDVKMAAPYNNFVADGFVVHNCGKTLALFELYAMAQALPGSMDPLLTERIKYHAAHGHDLVVSRLREEQEWIHDHFPDGARCCHYDIEAQFDKRRAAKVGVDLDALYLVETDVIEDVCATLEGLFGLFHVHGLDSTSQAQSLLALKQEPGQSAGYGVDARQWKTSLKHALAYFGPLKNGTGIPNMLVMIHQTSMNVKTGGTQAAVGKFIKFISSCTIEFQRGEFLWRKDGVLLGGGKAKAYGSAEAADAASMAGRAEADGVEVYAKIVKSRTCRPFRAAGMQFDYRRLAHVIPHELATCGLYFGIIVKSGSWFKVAGEEKNLGQGLKSVYARLADDEELRDRIVCQLLDFTTDGDAIDLKAKVDAVEQVDELEQAVALPSVTAFA